MFRLRLRLVATLLIGLGVLAPTTATADSSTDCQVQTRPGGVECLDDTGESVWKIEHPALFGSAADFERGADAVEPIGPVELDDQTFYGARRDLLEVDTDQGIVVDRVRFPAPITAVEADGRDLEVTVRDHLEDLADTDEARDVPIRYSPGDPSPPQHTWSAPRSKDLFATSRDANWLAELAGRPDEALRLLRQARETDPTNPFFSQEIGELLVEQGDDDAAGRAFEQAVESPGAVWRDLLAVSSRLEEADAPDQADRAFQRGLELMQQAGVDPERMTSLVGIASTLMLPTDQDSSIARAIQSADPEEIDRLLSRFVEFAPYVESGHYNWETLANWMLEEGEEGLAEKWRQIADENRDYAAGLFTRNIIQIDRAILALVSMAAALMILAFVIGMRGGLMRRRLHDRDDDAGHSLWLPRLRLRDLIVPVLLFVGCAAIPFYLATHLTVVDKLSDAPVATTQDGMASPATIEWLESLTDSSPVDELISTAIAEREALERGEQLPEKQPIVHDLIEALYQDARDQQLELVRQGRMPDLVDFTRTAGATPDQIGQPDSTSMAVLVVPLGLLLVIGFIGSVVGARAPRLAAPVLLIVPGGSAWLAPAGAVALAALMAALAAHAGLDSAAYEATKPAFLDYFGLQALDDHTPRLSRLWAWATIGVVALFQAAVVTRELRTAGDDPPPDSDADSGSLSLEGDSG